MLKMSPLWSPSAENAWDSLMIAVADGGALPAQIVRGGVDERTQRAHPPGSVGCSVSVSFCELLAQIVPFHRHRGAVLGNDRVVAPAPARRCRPVSAGWPARSPVSAT